MLRLGGIAASAAVVAALAAGCGQGPQPSAPAQSAPAISVVTGLYPLARIAAEVGGAHVRVTDVVADGTDPRAVILDAAQRAEVRGATVAVEVGDGYQPDFERAAVGGPIVVSLAPALGAGGSGAWLDPRLVARLATMLAKAFSHADPAAAASYANGGRDVVAEMGSVAADFQNSLSDCPRKVIVTADATFASMSRSFGLVDQVAGASPDPTQADVARATAETRAARATTVFSEPWVPTATVGAVGRAAGVKVRSLDTLIGAPAGGWPVGATYVRLLEEDLATLTSALQCAAMGQN